MIRKISWTITVAVLTALALLIIASWRRGAMDLMPLGAMFC